MNKRKIYQILALILCIGGLFLIAKPYYDGYQAKKKQQANIEVVNKMKYSKQETKFVDASEIVQPNLADISNAKLDQKSVIGRMVIPSISLELPILNAATEKNLLSGAGAIKEKQEMGKGNYALAGHNMSKKGILFSDISTLNKSDKIYLYDGEYEYEYAVQQVKEVIPSEWEVVEDHGQEEITLITCITIKNNAKRYVVSGDFVQKKKIEY